MVPDTEFLFFVEMSIQTSFPMTVKVDGLARDGTTMFIHNRVHNRTRTITCAGVSVRGPIPCRAALSQAGVLIKKIHTSDGVQKSSTFVCSYPYKCSLTYTRAFTHAHTHTHTYTDTHVNTGTHTYTHTHTLSICDSYFYCLCNLPPVTQVSSGRGSGFPGLSGRVAC